MCVFLNYDLQNSVGGSVCMYVICMYVCMYILTKSSRWSKNFGVTDTCTVSDLVDMKDVMQALNNVYNVGRKCAEMGLPHPQIVALEV